jgi:chemotaxis protein CheD
MKENTTKIMQYVNTGEVHSGGIEYILNSGAIGSYMVVIAFDSITTTGAMAHVMLPNKPHQKRTTHPTRYAPNAIQELLNQMLKKGVKKENIDLCIAGGANVLKRKNDTIGIDNVNSVKKLLKEEELDIKAEAIGGFERRTVLFDIEKGCIYYTVGDLHQKTLWQKESK